MVKFEGPGPNQNPSSPEWTKNAEKSRNDHLYSDVDLDGNSQHHTLGKGPTQAAPGSHGHSNYALEEHSHTPEDLPEVESPVEVYVQPNDPALDEDLTGRSIIWVNPDVPDANYQVIRAEYETDPFTVSVDAFAHPAKWGKLLFTAPDDGSLAVWCTVNFDSTNLLNNRQAKWRLRIYDSTGTIIEGKVMKDARTKDFSVTLDTAGELVRGETYSVDLEFALSNLDGDYFIVDSAQMTVIYFPRSVHTYITIPTDA